MDKRKRTKVVCKDYEAEVCEPKNNRVVCRKKKIKVCAER